MDEHRWVDIIYVFLVKIGIAMTITNYLSELLLKTLGQFNFWLTTR